MQQEHAHTCHWQPPFQAALVIPCTRRVEQQQHHHHHHRTTTWCGRGHLLPKHDLILSLNVLGLTLTVREGLPKPSIWGLGTMHECKRRAALIDYPTPGAIAPEKSLIFCTGDLTTYTCTPKSDYFGVLRVHSVAHLDHYRCCSSTR